MAVGFIGLGRMGAPMAARIAAAGHRVVGYDILPAKRQLAITGISHCVSPAEVAAGADVIVTSLPGPGEVADVVNGSDGLLKSLRPSTILVETSTISPELSRAIASDFVARNSYYLDASNQRRRAWCSRRHFGGDGRWTSGGSRAGTSDHFMFCQEDLSSRPRRRGQRDETRDSVDLPVANGELPRSGVDGRAQRHSARHAPRHRCGVFGPSPGDWHPVRQAEDRQPRSDLRSRCGSEGPIVGRKYLARAGCTVADACIRTIRLQGCCGRRLC